MCVLRWDCQWLEMECDDQPLSCSALPSLGICDLSQKLDVTFDGLWVGHIKASFIGRRWAFLSRFPLVYDTGMRMQGVLGR